MRPSPEQMDRIYQAWQRKLPPITTAQELRLVPLTVIREYVRLDDTRGTNTVSSADAD